MQLFITEYSKNDHIAITAPRVVHQVYKVLRMQSGDRFAVQKESATERLVVQLDTITPTTITASISQTIERPSLSDTTLIIAYPNKFEKIELIIQKLSEIGISDIIFRDGERSQLHTLSEHKIARCHTIALEAVEQSHGRVLPRISQISHLSDAHIHPQEAVVCDHHDTIDQTVLYKRSQCIVGPEGGLGPREYTYLQSIGVGSYSLGKHILRTETAAIIAGRLTHSLG